MNAPSWQINLHAPPRVVLLGTATHGESKLTESYYSHHWVLLYFRYAGEIVVDGSRLVVSPGVLGLFPPGSELVIHYRGPSSHHYAHLALLGGRTGEVAAQVLTPTHEKADEIEMRFNEAIRHSAHSPERSVMILWDILWFIVAHTPVPSNAGQTLPTPIVSQIVGRIEQRLAEALSVPELLAGLGYSQRYLSGKFREAMGCSIAVYLRSRRVERAKKLLEETSLPIKRIATDVGMGNLQQFNKLLRQATGKSPRRWRMPSKEGLRKP